MFEYIKDLYIMNYAGVLLFKITQDDSVQANLFGGLMNALSNFASNVAQSSLESIVLQNKKYIIFKKDSAMFVITASKKEKEKHVREELEHIVRLFFETYSEKEIKNWSGNMSLFEKFEKKLENEFLGAFKKFQAELW